jgi:two-component system response regulator AtoC
MSPRISNNSIRVLLVDDEELFREMTAETLTTKGFKVVTANDAKQALGKLDSQFFDVVLLDVRMPGMDGLQLLGKLSNERPTQQIVMLTGHATVPMAIEAMKQGAFDFLVKPAKLDDLMITIRRAAEHGQIQRRNIVLEEELQRTKGPGKIVGESEAIKKVHAFIEKAALTDLPVLITGESGTGKELVARAIHTHSRRALHPLIVVDGSTLHEQLLASELFGHEKGAFTGAVQKKPGLFEVADRGSILMDEIGELSSPNQTALLRVIEFGTFRPVGAVKEIQTDVRIIAATNRNLEQAVAVKEFRQDLYFRLNALTINMPPLRERRNDIPLLAEYFLKECEGSTKTQIELSNEALRVMVSYNWPGNVRELRHVIELAALFAIEDGVIEPCHLPEGIKVKHAKIPIINGTSNQVQEELKASLNALETLEEFRNRCEQNYIGNVMSQFDGNKSRVAKTLGISRALLYKKLRLLGLE